MTFLLRPLHFIVDIITTMLGVSIIVFFSLRIVPGDPVDLILGDSPHAPASEFRRAEMRHKLGLDLPAPTAYLKYALSASHGDLGTSISTGKPVTTLLTQRMGNSLLLALCATILAFTLAVPLGALAAKAGTRRSHVLTWVAAVTSSVPAFWLAPLLVSAFALGWPWLPVCSFDSWSALLLPSLTLAFGMFGSLARTSQEATAQNLSADYVRTARAKGLTESRILFHHILPNALPPIVVFSSLQFAHLLAGAVVTETLFDWPGLGTLLFDAIMRRDYPVVQGIVLITAFGYVVINALGRRVVGRFSV